MSEEKRLRPHAATVSRVLAAAGLRRSTAVPSRIRGFREHTRGFVVTNSIFERDAVEVYWHEPYARDVERQTQRLADALSERYDVSRRGDVLYVRRKGGEA